MDSSCKQSFSTLEASSISEKDCLKWLSMAISFLSESGIVPVIRLGRNFEDRQIHCESIIWSRAQRGVWS